MIAVASFTAFAFDFAIVLSVIWAPRQSASEAVMMLLFPFCVLKEGDGRDGY